MQLIQGQHVMKNIIDTAADAGKFTTLLAALRTADLTDTLKGKGPFTVFAPSDEAFKKLKTPDLDALLKDKAKLKSLLTYHVVSGSVAAKDIKAGDLKTLEGRPIAATLSGGSVTVNGAKVTKADIAASNGMIHIIDKVIMPKGMDLPKAA
jgi:uncharacterized surface protein with fasciclin (FAS1) repeats